MPVRTVAEGTAAVPAIAWVVVPPTTLLAVGYVGGLALWDRLGRRGRPGWLAAMVGLWCWISWAIPAPHAIGYTWLAVPPAILALRMFTERTAIAAVGAITALMVLLVARITGAFDPELLVPPAAAVWATVALYRGRQRLLGELRRTREELARGQREAGRLAERARIARDPHDTLAQELAGSRMLLQAADRDWDRRPDLARTQVRAVVDALGGVRKVPPAPRRPARPLAAPGESPSTSSTRTSARHTATPARVVFRAEGRPADLPCERAAALLRVAQGLLANACERARARQVWVTLDHRDEATVTVEVRDDGVGFDTASVPSRPGDRGHGLSAGRERLGALGGSLTLHSTPGRATLPVGAPALAGTAGNR